MYVSVRNYGYFNGDYNYSENLLTFDISDPANPQIIGNWIQPTTSLGFALATTISPTIAFEGMLVQARSGSLRFWSVADPNNPELAATLTPSNDNLSSPRSDGELIFVGARSNADPGGKIVICDPSDPFSPQIVGSVIIPDTSSIISPSIGHPNDGLLAASVREASSADERLVILDVSDPASPQIISDTPVADTLRNHRIIGTTLIASENDVPNGVFKAFDITDPVNPVQLADIDVGVTTGFIYPFGQTFATNSGHVLDFRDPLSPVIAGTFPSGVRNRELYFDSDRVFAPVASAAEIVRIVDLGSCLLPEFVDISAGGITDEGGAPVVVTTTSSGADSFQWFRDDVPLADGPLYTGATTEQLTIAANRDVVGVYTIELTNAIGTIGGGEALVGVRVNDSDPADIDNNSMVDVFDLIAFLQAFSAALSG